ncbi:MAG: hypothetical protein K8I02_09665 [Candidatus Methylomirabilis sp.]|nr:hypothetical protein [Deltaproteobacteria bacterium]
MTLNRTERRTITQAVLFVSTAAYAEAWAVSSRLVAKWCREGRFPGAFQFWVRGDWRVPVHYFETGPRFDLRPE